MAENPDEMPIGQPTEPEPASETPLDETTQVEITAAHLPKQETDNMEVHHHSHSHGKKNWRSYLWEFLMLFLAVFCGFLAEYQLEHKIERDRARELAKSFYIELQNDSVTAVNKSKNRERQEAAIQYITSYLADSSLDRVDKTFSINFEYGINFRTPSIFEPKTIILEQLKNSGSLRYFKSDELQTLIGELTVAIKNIYDRQDLETQNRLQYINPIIIQLYDYSFDAQLKKGGKTVFEGLKDYEASQEVFPFHIDDPAAFDRKNAVKVLNFYRANVINSTRVTFIRKYMEVNAALLSLLRQEYHID